MNWRRLIGWNWEEIKQELGLQDLRDELQFSLDGGKSMAPEAESSEEGGPGDHGPGVHVHTGPGNFYRPVSGSNSYDGGAFFVLGGGGSLEGGPGFGPGGGAPNSLHPPREETSTVDSTLQERGKRYGAFVDHARITQDFKRVMSDSKRWAELEDDQREALEMIAHKIARILNGDPDYEDSWLDVSGYAELVARRLRGEIL